MDVCVNNWIEIINYEPMDNGGLPTTRWVKYKATRWWQVGVGGKSNSMHKDVTLSVGGKSNSTLDGTTTT